MVYVTDVSADWFSYDQKSQAIFCVITRLDAGGGAGGGKTFLLNILTFIAPKTVMGKASPKVVKGSEKLIGILHYLRFRCILTNRN